MRNPLSGSVVVSLVVLAVGVAHGGCGGGTFPVIQDGNDAGGNSGDGGAGDRDGDIANDGGGSDAPSPLDGGGPISCGKAFCVGTELCMHPCCGGAQPQCTPKTPGSTCVAGSHDATCSDGAAGCLPDPCVPDPPYCVDPTTDGHSCMQQGNDLICLCN